MKKIEIWTAPDIESFHCIAKRMFMFAFVGESHWAYQHLVFQGAELMRLCEAETGWVEESDRDI